MTGLNVPFVALSANRKPRPIVTCDIETAGLNATPEAFVIGVVFDGTKSYRFSNVADMRAFLLSSAMNGKAVYAHNGGRYDYLSIFGNYWETFGAANVTMNEGRFIQAVHRPGGKHRATYFRDSLNIIPTSLAKIGDKFGFLKGHTPAKFINAGDEVKGEDGLTIVGTYEKGKQIVIEEEDWLYCERDCALLWKALDYFQERLGNLRPTLPSTAMAVFRREFFPAAGPIHIRRAEDLEFRDAYYGGRVEAYRIGNLPLPNWTYDVRSLYPASMVGGSYPDPTQLVTRGNVTPEELVNDLLPAYEGFATCRVRAPDLPIGLLPFVRADRRLLFPTGEFSGSWCFPELRNFVALGGQILEVGRATIAPPIPSPFVGYVDRYYRMKREATGFEREMAKLMLNALYGKFAEYHTTNHRYAMCLDETELANYRALYGACDWEPISRSRDDGYYVFPSRDGGIAGHSVFSWAAYITSRARVINSQIQMAIRSAGGEVFYTDTDSFTCSMEIVTDQSPEALAPIWPVGDELGQLGLEKKNTKAVHGNKHYILEDGSLVLKGVRRGAKLGTDGKYEWRSVIGLREAIRRNLPPGSPEIRARIPRTTYDKRIVRDDGSTTPITLTGNGLDARFL